ncbi:uncharacterized protein LOC111643666 isoform X3 [Copidosoma floridanum]|uniref:uncharacterized protein LOC111643666 isoform X3 n=1 Tax=Copidosoma floridanum TaxID=29053 RepID=UPI000C6F5EA9|nr:uncharacterized protein LOC111643666 isoform X3 [Copidosoma floridanum]
MILHFILFIGKSMLLQGTKKNQVDETFRTFDIPDQCDLERIKAGYHSNDVLCIRFPSRNELVVKVWTNKNVKSF